MKLVTKIPSLAKGVVIQLAPTWRVTSIIPPRKMALRNMGATSTEEEIPTIFFTHTRAPNLDNKVTYYSKPMAGHNYHILMGTEMKDGKIKGLPWCIGSHVGTSGAICWGRNPYPKDLRQAANMFFDTTFNWDPIPGSYQLKQAIESKKASEYFKELDLTKRILGTHHVVPQGSFDAVLISSEPEHLALVKDVAVDGAEVPGSDLFDYTPGGFGASRIQVPKASPGVSTINNNIPIKYDDDTIEVKDAKMGKVIYGLGSIQPDQTILFEIGGKKFVYNQENDTLLVA